MDNIQEACKQDSDEILGVKEKTRKSNSKEVKELSEKQKELKENILNTRKSEEKSKMKIEKNQVLGKLHQ